MLIARPPTSSEPSCKRLFRRVLMFANLRESSASTRQWQK